MPTGRSEEPCGGFESISDELKRRVFGFLDGQTLARVREVCTLWNQLASAESLWKALCLKQCSSLLTDEALWGRIDQDIDMKSQSCWRRIYPKVYGRPRKIRLQKTSHLVANVIARQIRGPPLGDVGLPSSLIVERRFHIDHLPTFLVPDAAVVYFEPESDGDGDGFDDFIEYLRRRNRAGLALDEHRRYMLVPSCEYTDAQVMLQGRRLLGFVQNVYPPRPQWALA